jgi:hypothetical protein
MDNMSARTADFGAQVTPMSHRHKHVSSFLKPSKFRKLVRRQNYHINVFLCPSINWSVHLSICVTVCPLVLSPFSLSFPLFIHIIVYLSIPLFVDLFVYHTIPLSVYPSVCLSVRHSFCPSVWLSIFPSCDWSICQSIRFLPSFQPSVCLSVCLSIYPFIIVYLSIYLSLCSGSKHLKNVKVHTKLRTNQHPLGTPFLK